MQNSPSSTKVNKFHSKKEASMSFMVSEEVTVKEGGPRMIVTGYSSGMVECRWYDGYGVKREAFHETELVPGRGVVLRKKFERVSLTPKPDHIRPGVPMPAMNDSRVLSCHHYKIIAVLRYAIARLCQNHKKAGWESSGCSTRQKWKTRAG